MKLCRHVLTALIVLALVILPATRAVLAQEAGAREGNQAITASQPKIMATAEEKIPVQKKPGIGKYWIAGAVGVALLAALAAGGGGGGGGGGTSAGDTGAVEVGW